MSDNSSIEWTDATWNPIRGCTKISPGCAHCYAETFAERFRGVPGHPYEQGFDLRTGPREAGRTAPLADAADGLRQLDERPVPQGRARRLHRAVARVMVAADWHTYQVLTKRSERMRDMLRRPARVRGRGSPTSGGASASRTASTACRGSSSSARPRPECGSSRSSRCWKTWARSTWTGIDWVIVGGESGPGARPMRRDWVASIRDQCHAAGVPFFFKQWGGSPQGQGRPSPRRPDLRRRPAPSSGDRSGCSDPQGTGGAVLLTGMTAGALHVDSVHPVLYSAPSVS